MNKILGIYLSILCWLYTLQVSASEKFDVLPDLPDPLSCAVQPAQASSVSTTNDITNTITTAQSAGHEPNLISILLSLVFVVLLIYATGIIYAKLNKLGMVTLKRQIGEAGRSHVSVVSTTTLGNNKTLHVVELDGKRMLIGASSNSIHLIKDLGVFKPDEIQEGEFSKIEIPNICIPKIEIPKIEIPSIDFSKIVTKSHKKDEKTEETKPENPDEFVITDIYEEENPDGIIDKLFDTANGENEKVEQKDIEHKVDPDEFALYKKYLG